ncbi:hypothetical protein EV426DRAFT_604657 [Tirmania nivea]|nr:hypothetical protein EV426DRAFT_604657 [Tirmania nivea]
MDVTWPFGSVWQLVKGFAQINTGSDYREYPIHCVSIEPSFPDPRQDQDKPCARHKLLEALWSACFYVCEAYAHCQDPELDQKSHDPQLEELVMNLCYQLRPEWEPPLDGSSQSILTASLKAASRAVTLLVGKDTSISSTPEPMAGANRGLLHLQSQGTRSLQLHLDLVSNLWELRQERRAQYQAPHIHLPFRACEGDDLWLQRESPSDPSTDEDLVVYRCYNRSYIDQLEVLLTSLHALFFQIITRFRHRLTCDTTQADDDLQQNVSEVRLCWAVCESLQGLTYRATETDEGWMIYVLRRDSETGLRLERAYAPEGLTRWELNPWGRISRPSQPLPELNPLTEHGRASNDRNNGIPVRPSWEVPQGSDNGGSRLVQDTEALAIGVAATTPQSSSTISHRADRSHRPATWASLLTTIAPRAVASERPSCPSTTARSALDDGPVSVTGSDAGFATACDCNCVALDGSDLDDLHHIRLRILLRTAAIQQGWNNGHSMSLRDFVRDEMSPISFGKSEKRRKLFMDYRNAMLNPQNNIKDRGDMAAHEGTVAQIKRAVEWKTVGGKHQFLRDLFRAVIGREIGQVDDGCDEVIVA